MFIDPNALNQQIVDELETLATYLEDEVDERVRSPQALPPYARRCKEVLNTIRVLLPKLRTLDLPRDAAPSGAPSCINCD